MGQQSSRLQAHVRPWHQPCTQHVMYQLLLLLLLPLPLPLLL
jgi:hypothetical protein